MSIAQHITSSSSEIQQETYSLGIHTSPSKSNFNRGSPLPKMSPLLKYTATLLSTVLPYTLAQTYTNCNPLEKTCSSDTGSTQSTLHYNFVESSSTLAEWTTLSGNPTISSEGVELTINKQGDAPTIETPYYIFFGEVSVVMKASAGTGIISSIVLESDDLDEVDWVNTTTTTTHCTQDTLS